MQNCKYEIKILLCEDSQSTIKSFANSLKHRFEEVITAPDGVIGLQKYKQCKPDLIITDIKMPNLDGIEMARKIREEDKQTRIVFISGYTEIKYFLNAIDYGISAFIQKPVDFRIMDIQLEPVVEEILLQRRIKKEEQKRIALQKKHQKLYDKIKQDLSLARSVQEYLLPDWLYLSNKLFFSVAYSPSLYVGGDLFGYNAITPSRYVFFLGDVSGHGIKSAMLMMAAYSTINILIEQEKAQIIPHKIVNDLNAVLCSDLFLDNDYMTLIMGTIDLEKRLVTYIRAGHPEIILYNRQSNKAELLNSHKGSIPVGMMRNYQYTQEDEESFILDDNQTVFLYSDGLYECDKPDGSRLGQIALIDELNKFISQTHPLTSPQEFMQYIKDIGYNTDQDDITMLSFFIPNSATVPDLKDYYQVKIPQNNGIGRIKCADFLLKVTMDQKFSQRFENDVNKLFYSGEYKGEKNLTTSFFLLLAYQNDLIECIFWLRSASFPEFSNCEKFLSRFIDRQIKKLKLESTKFVKYTQFKNLGDYIQISCLINPHIV